MVLPKGLNLVSDQRNFYTAWWWHPCVHDYEDNEDEEQVLSVRPLRRGWGVQISDGEFLPPKHKSWRVRQDWVIEAMQGEMDSDYSAIF